MDLMLSALTEVFATFACARAMDSPRLGRRASLAAMMSTITVSLVFSNPNPSPNPNPDPDPNPNPDPNPYPNQVSLVFSLAFTPLARWVSLVGKFAATGAFNLIYIQTAELFPTVVRTTALGLCSAAARLGSIIASPLGRYAGPRVCMLLIRLGLGLGRRR